MDSDSEEIIISNPYTNKIVVKISIVINYRNFFTILLLSLCFKPSPKLLSYLINTYIYSQAETEINKRYRQDYPASSFEFEQNFKSSWELIDNLGLSTENFETALDIDLNTSKTDTFIYHSDNYNCPITVLVSPNYTKEYYDVYDKDLVYDDYIGQTYIKYETGYYIKIIEQ